MPESKNNFYAVNPKYDALHNHDTLHDMLIA